MRKGIIALCIIAFCSFAFMGCEKEGPAEKAGKKLDQAFDAAKDKVKEVTK